MNLLGFAQRFVEIELNEIFGVLDADGAVVKEPLSWCQWVNDKRGTGDHQYVGESAHDVGVKFDLLKGGFDIICMYDQVTVGVGDARTLPKVQRSSEPQVADVIM